MSKLSQKSKSQLVKKLVFSILVISVFITGKSDNNEDDDDDDDIRGMVEIFALQNEITSCSDLSTPSNINN